MITFSYSLLSGGSGGGSTSLTSPFSGIPSPSLNFAELALDPGTGDLMLPIQILRGADAIVQKIRSRFRFFKGEWFLDKRLGVPYLESIFVKNPDRALINAVFRRVLTTTPGVDHVASFDSQKLDNVLRALTVDFQAVLVDGTKVIAQAEPFLIG